MSLRPRDRKALLWLLVFLLTSSAATVVAEESPLHQPPRPPPPLPRDAYLLWNAPVGSATGYGNEAIEFLRSLRVWASQSASSMRPSSEPASVRLVDYGALHHGDQASRRVSLSMRLKTVIRILSELRRPDFQAAGHFMHLQWGGLWGPLRWVNFFCWAVKQLLVEIPRAAADLQISRPVSRTPMWLLD